MEERKGPLLLVLLSFSYNMNQKNFINDFLSHAAIRRSFCDGEVFVQFGIWLCGQLHGLH